MHVAAVSRFPFPASRLPRLSRNIASVLAALFGSLLFLFLVAPIAQLVATAQSGGKVVRSRAICPFPQVARYSGTGDTADPANYACAAPGG